MWVPSIYIFEFSESAIPQSLLGFLFPESALALVFRADAQDYLIAGLLSACSPVLFCRDQDVICTGQEGEGWMPGQHHAQTINQGTSCSPGCCCAQGSLS